MESNRKDGRKTVLPYYDLVFKKTFASPENIHISEGLLEDLSDYDPLGLMSVTSLEVETPYNFKDVNQLIADNHNEILITEVDFACKDINGARYTVEVQVLSEFWDKICYPSNYVIREVFEKPVISMILKEITRIIKCQLV